MNDILAACAFFGACPIETKGRRRYGLSALRSLIALRREQAYFRLELKRIAMDNPHLIDDIGLTREEVEAEIAKLPFWQR